MHLELSLGGVGGVREGFLVEEVARTLSLERRNEPGGH